MENNLLKRRSLLLKNSWSHKDIAEYMAAIDNHVGQVKAVEMKKKAAKNGGELLYKHGHVTVDSVLALLGTSKSKELAYLNMLGLKFECINDDTQQGSDL